MWTNSRALAGDLADTRCPGGSPLERARRREIRRSESRRERTHGVLSTRFRDPRCGPPCRPRPRESEPRTGPVLLGIPSHFLGLGPDGIAGRDIQGPVGTDVVPTIARRGVAGRGRVARPDPRRRAHRPPRRPHDVPADRRADDPPHPVRRFCRQQPDRPAHRRFLPGHRRHLVRRRRPHRQLLVPAEPARYGDRHLRRRHGRHGHRRVHDPAAPRGVRRPGAVRPGRDPAGRVRGRRPDAPEELADLDARPGKLGRQGGQDPRPSRHPQTGLALRDGLRRVRGVLRLSAHVPAQLLRVGDGGRGPADRRVRGDRGGLSTSRRRAGRQVPRRLGAHRELHRHRVDGRRRDGAHAARQRGCRHLLPRRDGGLPVHGRVAGHRLRRRVRPGGRTGRAHRGRVGHRHRRCRRRPRRLRPPAVLFVLSIATAAFTWLWFLCTRRSEPAATERTPA